MKTAVVLMNLGGPDGLQAVRPFLFNLFNDPAIIDLPQPFRWCLARIISGRRAPIAREIYEILGGSSPLLANTRQQADALESILDDEETSSRFKVFITMRYWHPFSNETAAAVKAWGAEQVFLLPLYPQFSTTTSGSSIKDWYRAAGACGLKVPTTAMCCYPAQPGFVDAVAGALGQVLDNLAQETLPRVLFSAHGLPKKIVDNGDPYQWQVERSVDAVVASLARADLDWGLCYQSRVGRLEWIGPATEDEIMKAAGAARTIVVVPIAFVSEHSETLVELDVEYRDLAMENGAAAYHRVPTVADDGGFIAGLATLVRKALAYPQALCCGEGERICPASLNRCPLADRSPEEAR
jgi:ferrochelatase